MPELPEVETIVRSLRSALVGRAFARVRCVTDLMIEGSVGRFERDLTGASVVGIRRHGKAIFIDLKPSGATARTLRVHLGMTGQFVFEEPDRTLAPHTHVIFGVAGLSRELRFRDIRRFGSIAIVPTDKTVSAVPDAWDAPDAVLLSALRGRTGRAKAVLMNQSVIAGLGNIYVDESLFRSRIHPLKRLASVRETDLSRLCAAIRSVLRESIELGGTSFRNYIDTEGGRGGFKGRLSVYGKGGRPCACGASIRRIVVGGRSTHFCPACQRRTPSRSA